MGSPPFVVVVEDDETLGEFFSMVLETMPVTHRICRSAEEALSVLAAAPADVLVTDLLLPGLDGRTLLKTIRHEGRLRGPARLVVMSGTVDDTIRLELTQLGVWQVLSKPVSVKTFKACIESALSPPAPALMTVGTSGTATQDSDGLSAHEQEIIQTLFGGHEALFLAYRQSSLQQFPRDLEQGELALRRHDMAGLRRVAHNLKSVLKTLGHDALSESARHLEDHVAQWLELHQGGLAPGQTPWPAGPDVERGWTVLNTGLRELISKATG